MNTEAEIRVKGMQALIGALGLVDANQISSQLPGQPGVVSQIGL
jgi:hypothetical protein